jgi:3-dehydroquinate synthase
MTTADSTRNLVLTGFMGTGKSAVGRQVAARLQRPFVDTDQLIEQRTGLPIPDIFEQVGEPCFRDLEAELCRELSAARGLVIGTGGWTLGPSDNRAAIESGGLVICLTADVPSLIRRLGSGEGRPMLRDAAWQTRLKTLLAARQPVYTAFPFRVNTARRSVDEAADQVLALWETFEAAATPLALPVMSEGSGYPVVIGSGLLGRAAPLIRAAGRWTGLALISDDNVGPLYADLLARALAPTRSGLAPTGSEQAGQNDPGRLPVTCCTLPAGERHKTLATVTDLYGQFLAAGLDRQGAVVALGGGVVGDVAGFAAATYMRGLPLVQLPTSLLAMVDSSVGGKTGVDLPAGKNLVGAFKQPELVIIDPGLLASLPPAELRAGLAEAVKAGVIGSVPLFERLEQGRLDDMAWIIRQAVAVKIEVVEADPYEQGRRAVLNLGHTFGHAFEVLSDFRLRHGEAVAMGMVAAARLSAALGRCPAEVARRIARTLERLGLPVAVPDYEPEAVLAAMLADKKKQGSRLRFVLPLDIGRVEVFDDVPDEAVLAALAPNPR